MYMENSLRWMFWRVRIEKRLLLSLNRDPDPMTGRTERSSLGGRGQEPFGSVSAATTNPDETVLQVTAVAES